MLVAMRIVFMGSPEFALPSLRRLIDSEHEVVAVYTQPDRPVGRGRKLAPPPVKLLALEHQLDVRQPPSISDPAVVEEMRGLAPDIGVIAAYGQILRQRVLDVPPLGVLNVHASLLPRWRGAAPIPAAILAGDEETGATIMRVVRELDAGPMIDAVRVPVNAQDTTATLTPRIADAGADRLLDVLGRIVAGDVPAAEQARAEATFAPQIKKTDALIDWARDGADHIWRKVRAYNPWPVAYSYLDGQPLRILECIPLAHHPAADPGTIVSLGDGDTSAQPNAGFAVVAADGVVGVMTVQGAGGNAMAASAYLRGHADIMGKRMSSELTTEAERHKV